MQTLSKTGEGENAYHLFYNPWKKTKARRKDEKEKQKNKKE